MELEQKVQSAVKSQELRFKASETLHDAVAIAFASNRYPGDERLSVYDPAGRDFDETFHLLRGGSWQEMPVAEFIRGDTPLADLTPEAFHYYMPALLLASLDDGIEVNSDIASSLAYYLSLLSADDPAGTFRHADAYNRRISLFSEDQRAIMIRVLEEYVARGWEAEKDLRQTIAILLAGL